MSSEAIEVRIDTRSTARESSGTPERIGALLINLGTPDEPTTPAVRRYLREFLSDPRVIDMNPLGRFLLVNLIIAPFRSSKSAHAYRQIWGEEGSPLLTHGKRLASSVQGQLENSAPGKYAVKLAMRYGNPSIRSAMEEFARENIRQIRAIPLFPQYASATVGSAVERLYSVAKEFWNVPAINIVQPFYDSPAYLNSVAEVTRESVAGETFDYYLFSFHGLPERHIKKSEPSGRDMCLKSDSCCARLTAENGFCYRAQCFATARSVAGRLGLEDGTWSVSFQSRLGKDPWIKPYTDEVTKALAQSGVRSLAVLSPAFVADCIETLEELGLRGKEDFEAAGGERYKLVESLNSHESWALAVADMIRQGV